MRIYAFTEHYPNTYKPYFDTQFARFLQDGHELRVFAFGKFEDIANAKTVAHGLAARTTYVPWTLRSLSERWGDLARVSMAQPSRAKRQARIGAALHQPWRRRALDAARAAMLPDEPPDLCLIHNLVTAQAFTFLRKLYPSARVALYFHGGEIPNGGIISDADTARAFDAVDVVFTNTEFSRGVALARGCPAEKLRVCPVGFELRDYPAPAMKLYRAGGILQLLSVGRLSEEKGLTHAIEAARRLRDSKLTEFRYRIVGKGPAWAALRRQVAEAGLEREVEFVGERPSHALLPEYEAADVLLLPSVSSPRWAETQACVVQEALLMKLLVISTRTGGVPESLAPCMAPLSVAPADPGDIFAKLKAILELPMGHAAWLGSSGREFALRRYDIRKLNAQLLAQACPDRFRPYRTAEVAPPSLPVARFEEAPAAPLN